MIKRICKIPTPGSDRSFLRHLVIDVFSGKKTIINKMQWKQIIFWICKIESKKSFIFEKYI